MSADPLTVFAGAYGAVLVGELAGDKLLFAVTALAARYRLAVVALGILPALAGKALAAVLLGRFVAQLSPGVVAGMTAITFAATAVALWRRRPAPATPAAAPRDEPAGRGVVVAFAAVFLAEWGDIGQLTTAALAARLDAPLLVWLAATAALTTKAALALTLGMGLRRYAPQRLLRSASVAVCLVLAVLALSGPER